jgi:hypothetical protein
MAMGLLSGKISILSCICICLSACLAHAATLARPGLAHLMPSTALTDCFLRLWNGRGLRERWNWDNGDLLSTLLEVAAPDLQKGCEPLRDSQHEAFKDCFSKAHPRLLLLNRYMPITILPPLGGFWK